MATITELTNKYTEIDNAKKAAFAAIIEKDVTVPDGTKLSGMAALIRSIPAGGSGITATNENIAYDIITTSQNWTAPKAVGQEFRVYAVGGGGGGSYDSSHSYGGGGGGGYIEIADLVIQEGEVVPIVCGAGGAGYNNGTAAENGGDTSFGDHIVAHGGKCPVVNGTEVVSGGDGGAGGGGSGNPVTGTTIAGNGGNGGTYGGGGGGSYSLGGGTGGNGNNGYAGASADGTYSSRAGGDGGDGGDGTPFRIGRGGKMIYDNGNCASGGGGGYGGNGGNGGIAWSTSYNACGGGGGGGFFGDGGNGGCQNSAEIGGGGGGGFFCNGGNYTGGGGGFFCDGGDGYADDLSDNYIAGTGGDGGVLIVYIVEGDS